MKEDNGWITLLQITVGAYLCYFQYIMYLMMISHNANDTRKERQYAIRRVIKKLYQWFRKEFWGE